MTLMSTADSTFGGRKWLLTTCRGRAHHLREALPTWLHHLPDWSPLVVCCDDLEAFTYAASALGTAGRGAAVFTRQGDYFSRLEAIRLGVRALETGIDDNGTSFKLQFGVPRNEPDLPGRIAIFDADTVALSVTKLALVTNDPDAVLISKPGARHNFGFICARAAVIQHAVNAIPQGMFDAGYSFEDTAIRVAAWVETNGNFESIAPLWGRIGHPDAERVSNYRNPMHISSRINATAIGRLITDLIDPKDWAACVRDCMPGQRVALGTSEQRPTA